MQTKLQALSQGNRPAEEYFLEFEQLRMRTGFDVVPHSKLEHNPRGDVLDDDVWVTDWAHKGSDQYLVGLLEEQVNRKVILGHVIRWVGTTCSIRFLGFRGR